MSKLLFNRAFSEHTIEEVPSLEILNSTILFKQKEGLKCVEITQDKRLNTNFYIGVDSLKKKEIAIYVDPKLNDRDL